MNIEALHLKNFKRFSDLRIDLSSLDLSGPAKGLRDYYLDYFTKQTDADMSVNCTLGGGIRVQRANNEQVSTSAGWDGRSAFYGRSSLRTVPELSGKTRAPIDLTEDADRPQRSIEQDSRFTTDVSQITEKSAPSLG